MSKKCNKSIKASAKYKCKKCGAGAKKKDKLCKPVKLPA